ncbi:MAG: DUF2130 domain-containing protein [Candidatus Sulfotelmatobacter sp.]
MSHWQKSTEQIPGTKASQDRRTVVLDIETVTLDPADETGALDALRGRIAKALRQTLIEVAMAKGAVQGRDGKVDQMFTYLTGPHFRGRVSAIVEACVGMQEDLDAEKRAISKQWAKRQRRLELLMNGTAGMYGDLQGIVGKSIPELDGLTMPFLGDGLGPKLPDNPDPKEAQDGA